MKPAQYPPRYPRIDADPRWIPRGDQLRWPPSVTNLQNNSTEGSRPVPAACFAQFVAHVRRAPGQCAKHSPAKVSRTLHAAYSRAGPRDALAACEGFGHSNSPPRIAQIAHRRYAAQYARLVRIRPRTDSRFALRFAPSYANLVRTRPAVTPLVTTGSYQCERLPGAGFHCGFHQKKAF